MKLSLIVSINDVIKNPKYFCPQIFFESAGPLFGFGKKEIRKGNK